MDRFIATLLLPARLTVRALDDLHAIARGIQVLSITEQEVRDAARTADARTTALLEVEAAMVAAMAPITERIVVLDDKLPDTRDVLAMIDDLRSSMATLAQATKTLDRDLPSTARVLDAVDELRDSLRTLADTAEALNRDMPSTDRVVQAIDEVRESLGTVADTAGTLQPAARTLGRVAERLPGNRGD